MQAAREGVSTLRRPLPQPLRPTVHRGAVHVAWPGARDPGHTAVAENRTDGPGWKGGADVRFRVPLPDWTSSIPSPLTPEQFQEPRWARFLFPSQAAAWLWLVDPASTSPTSSSRPGGTRSRGRAGCSAMAPDQGMVSGAVASRGHPRLVRVVPRRTSSAQRRACCDARRRSARSPSGLGPVVGLLTGIAVFAPSS